MARNRVPHVPKLCQRKDGRLYATDPALKRQIYFKSVEEYERWRQDFLARIREMQPPEPMSLKPGARLSVAKLCEAYLLHARAWYRKEGEETSEVRIIEMMIRRIDAVAGDTQADRLRVADVEAFLERSITDGLSRRTINSLLRKLRLMVRWAVRKEVASGETLGRILSVPGLKKGRTEAREKPKVKPVSLNTIEETLPLLRPIYRAVVQLELWTGMRPGEVIRLCPEDIDRSSEPWEYKPKRYKTEHLHEDQDEHRRRRIYFGPKSQGLLLPLLDQCRHEEEPVFRGSRGRPMTIHTYYSAVKRACRKGKIPHWFPNQLRHATATAVRARFGAEAASNYLGHEHLNTTEIYAEKSQEQAKKIAEEMG